MGLGMRVFISFHSLYRDDADRLRKALASKKPDWDFFFSPLNIPGGVFWIDTLGEEIAKADAFLFVLGKSVGPWQTLEYDAAIDRKVKARTLPPVPRLPAQACLP